MNGESNMNGTSIQDIKNQIKMDEYNKITNSQEMEYNTMQNLQHEQGHSSANTIQQALGEQVSDPVVRQHLPYYNEMIQPNINYPQYCQNSQISDPNFTQMNNNRQHNMGDLARDISNNLPNDNSNYMKKTQMPIQMPEKAVYDEIDNIENILDVDMLDEEENDGGYLKNIPEILREPLIIGVIFVILSQPSVHSYIGKYIKQVNPNESGKVTMIGIVIYGLILSALYVLSKRILMNK